jgi:hypothetical protein
VRNRVAERDNEITSASATGSQSSGFLQPYTALRVSSCGSLFAAAGIYPRHPIPASCACDDMSSRVPHCLYIISLLRDDRSGVTCFIMSTMRRADHHACVYRDITRMRRMGLLTFTWASGRRTTVALPGADMAGADAPAPGNAPTGKELRARERLTGIVRNAAALPDSELSPAVASEPARVPTLAPSTGQKDGIAAYKPARDSSQAHVASWRAGIDVPACGADAADGGGEESRATRWLGGGGARSRRAQGGAARCRGARSASARSRVRLTSAVAAQVRVAPPA